MFQGYMNCIAIPGKMNEAPFVLFSVVINTVSKPKKTIPADKGICHFKDVGNLSFLILATTLIFCLGEGERSVSDVQLQLIVTFLSSFKKNLFLSRAIFFRSLRATRLDFV